MSLLDLKADELDMVEIFMGLEDEFQRELTGIDGFLTKNTTGKFSSFIKCSYVFLGYTNLRTSRSDEEVRDVKASG